MNNLKAVIDIRNKGAKIDRHVYGHFSEHLGRCIYDGYWVGEDSKIPNIRGIRSDIVEAMKAIKTPNIRWPGGCFADDYYWMDGIGPKSERVPIVNVHWGGVLENNHFGTHEFMDLCEQIGCEPYICGNVGSGTVREMRNWVEYLTDDGQSPMAQLRRKNGREKAWNVKFFGIGNENWGCGGFMEAEYYAHEFRKYATYVRNYQAMGKTNWWESPQITRIAGGANAEQLDWTETLMRKVPSSLMGGLSVHCYVKPGEESHGTVFTEKSWYETAANTFKKEPLLKQQVSIMDYYDPENKVIMAVDEWGIWVDNEPDSHPGFLYQQNTMRSALCAALMFHIFHKFPERIRLASLAQTINVLQSIILTEGEKMIKTPTYHVFDLFKGHQDSNVIPITWDEKPEKIELDLPQVDMSASLDDDGVINITLVNISASSHAKGQLGFAEEAPLRARGRILEGEVTAHNTFDNPNNVTTKEFKGIKIEDGNLYFDLPPCAIVSLEVEIR
ncbi:MAG: alpha-N-arabinofuranosidase [Clostridiales bacterium]|nr:alpha-N-arabinofuranosidase [Clostridiales bacterium]